MDSISQAVWGALSAEASTKKSSELKIQPWVIGLVGGTLPDLDSFFRSSTDPLFATLMHRHFTHSILMIPVGALLCWFIFWPFFKNNREHYKEYYKISFFAYGTHWILDFLTSYGTQIFWPMTNHRYSLDWLSIVDPLLTIPWLVVFMILVFLKSMKSVALKSIIIYTVLYFSFAGLQEYRAEKAVNKIAQSQGHTPERVRVFPSLGNSFWFRGIYLYQGQIYSQGLLVSPHRSVLYRPGQQIKRVDPQELLTNDEVINRQIQIWNWFVDDWMYFVDSDQLILGDGRYSMSAEGFETLWALHVDKENPQKSVKKMPDQNSLVKGRKPTEGFELLLNPQSLLPLE